MRDTINSNSSIKTDGWAAYKSLKNEFPQLEQILSGKKGENFSKLHRAIMMFKTWLRGTHHRVRDLQEYINEYSYRFNRSVMKAGIFDNLLSRMILHTPAPYKLIIA